VFAGSVGQEGEGGVELGVVAVDDGCDDVEAGGPEGFAVGIDQPPALAVVLGGEEAGFALRVGSVDGGAAAPVVEGLWPGLFWRFFELLLESGGAFFEGAGF